MANRKLDTSEIHKLVAISDKQAKANDTRGKWPGRENLRKLAQAVKEKRPTVVLTTRYDDGGEYLKTGPKRFKIRYTTHFGGAVYISPDFNAFIPSGYFKIERLNNILNAPVGLEEDE